MKKTFTIIIAGAVLFLFPNVLSAQDASQDFSEQHNNTGQTFYDWCKDYPEGESHRLCQGYLSSAMILLEKGISSAGPDVKICLPEGTEFDEMVTVFMAHMDANPELMPKRGGAGVTAAWMSAYPCE